MTSVYCLRSTNDFQVHRIVFLNHDKLENARRVFHVPKETKEMDPEHLSSPQKLFSTLTKVLIYDTSCRSSNKSKTIIDLVCNF